MDTEEREARVQALEAENAQLRIALESRIVIEQAKGALSVTMGIPPDRAYEALRAHARRQARNIHAVAAEVVKNGGRLAAPAR
jgi:AmiR/NasT family two-component response regulator